MSKIIRPRKFKIELKISEISVTLDQEHYPDPPKEIKQEMIVLNDLEHIKNPKEDFDVIKDYFETELDLTKLLKRFIKKYPN